MKFFLFLFLFSSLGILPKDIRWSCATTLFSNIAMIGDSRADQFSFYGAPTDLNFIQHSRYHGKPIFNPREVVLQGLAQEGTKASDWVEKIKRCQDASKVNFRVPKYTVFSLGGNDALNYIKEKFDHKQVSDSQKLLNQFQSYFDRLSKSMKEKVRVIRKTSINNFHRNPFKSIATLLKATLDIFKIATQSITGNPTIKFPDFSANWEWQDKVIIDQISTDMEFVTKHFLEQSALHNTLLNVVQPAGPKSFLIAYGKGVTDSKFYFANTLKLFNKLRTEYTTDLWPRLRRVYGNRVLILDTYNRYMHNALFEGESMYVDGIHFTGGQKSISDELLAKGKYSDNKVYGNAYWGDKIALTIAIHGWFNSLLPIHLSGFYSDSAVQSATQNIFEAARARGLSPEEIEASLLEPLRVGFTKYFPSEPITITYMGWDFQFDNDKAFYFREGTNHAYMVRGDIRLFYETEGGPDGRPDGTGMKFGYPIEDEIVGSIFESFRSQKFECGIIQRNYFAFTEPYKVIPTPDSPECLAKQERDKNF